MTHARLEGGRADYWSIPKPFIDPSLRLLHYGPIQPMEPEGLIDRLLRRRRRH